MCFLNKQASENYCEPRVHMLKNTFVVYEELCKREVLLVLQAQCFL